jgi:hypothetical protein
MFQCCFVTLAHNTPFTSFGYNGNYYAEAHDDARHRGAAAAAAAAATATDDAAAAAVERSPSFKSPDISMASPSDRDLTQNAQ